MKRTFIQSELLLDAGAVNAVSLRVEGKPHQFSMRLNGTATAVESENRREFFEALGFSENSVAAGAQVHGDNIELVESPGRRPSTDALMTRNTGLFLAISVADCVPILMFDKKIRSAAAVHAGWRGTVRSIVSKTATLMDEKCGSSPEDIVAFIGPCAGSCCYEVGQEVVDNFHGKFFAPGVTAGKYMLDLKSANADQLVRFGIPRDNIEISEYCTICNTDFHSYRREGESSGRMLAVIGII